MNTTFKKILAVCLGISPLLLMAYLFDKYAVNIPHWDDHALKGFILNLDFAKSLSEKLSLFFSFHNEHRIVFTRFVTWLIVKFNGTIDYRIMMIVGNSAIIGIWVYFISCVNKYRLSAWYIAISGWLLFSLATSEILFWGMASVQNFWVIFWSLTTFYLLVYGEMMDMKNPFVNRSIVLLKNRPTNRLMFYTAMLTALLALFTSGNGVLVPFIGLFILLLQKRFISSLYWSLSVGLVTMIHFLTTEVRPDEVNDASEVTFNHILSGATTLAGAIFDTDWAYPDLRFKVAQGIGGILIIISIVLFFRRIFIDYALKLNLYVLTKRKTDLFMSATILFVGGTMGGIIFSRLGLGMGVFLTGKYKIYSILLLIVCTLYLGRLLAKKYRKVGLIAAVLLSIGLWVNSYFNDYQFVQNQYMQRRVDLANWKKEARTNNVELADYPYKAPEVNLFDNVNFENYVISDSLIDDIKIFGDKVIFYENELEAVNQQVYFILKSDTKTYYFSTKPQRNNSRIGIFRNYFQNGFTVNVSRFDVDTDFYQVYVMIRNKEEQVLITNKKLIRIDGLLRNVVKTNW
jgi:hypothetical protein